MEYNSNTTEVLGERRKYDGKRLAFLLHTDEENNQQFIIADGFKEKPAHDSLDHEYRDYSWERAERFDSINAAAPAWLDALAESLPGEADVKDKTHYRVFNSKNADNISPKWAACNLPEATRDYVKTILEGRAGTDAAAALMETPLESLPTDVIGPQDLADIMDRLAIEESFDPEKVTVEEAAWVVKDPAGHQAAYEVHLTDDEISPNGFGWYTEMYVFDPGKGKWVSDDGGMWWGYGNAPELAAEMPMPPSIDWDNAQVVRAPYGLLDDLGVWDDEGRVASVEEIEAFKELDWEQIDTPKSELTPTPWKQDVPPARACNVSVAESLEAAKKQAGMAKQAKAKPPTVKTPKL